MMMVMMHCYFVPFQRQKRAWLGMCHQFSPVVCLFGYLFIHLQLLLESICKDRRKQAESLSIELWHLSHLTTLPLSFGRVNQPEGAEDERDDPSRAPHPWIVDGAKGLRSEPATVNCFTASSPVVRSSARLLFRI